MQLEQAPGTRTTSIWDSVRVAGGEHRVTRFELFFDLVFVFAFTQVTQLMTREHDALGVLHGMIILGLLWWSWVAFAWLGNQAYADRGLMPIVLGVAASLMFIVALAIPDAFADDNGARLAPLVLAGAYVSVRVIHTSLYLVAAREDAELTRQLVITNSIAAGPMAVLLLTGAWVGGGAQTWLWLTALVYDAAVVFVTSGQGGFRVNSSTHAAERFGLIVILALGESTISMGLGLSDVGIDAVSIIAVFLAIAGNFLLWWMYFHRFEAAVEESFSTRTGTRRIKDATVVYTFGHFPIVAGIVLTAAGVESAMAHIDEFQPLGSFGSIAIGAGGSLFLASTAAIWFRMTRRVLTIRLVAGVLFLASSIFAAQLVPIAFLIVFVLTGATVVILESRSRSRLPG